MFVLEKPVHSSIMFVGKTKSRTIVAFGVILLSVSILPMTMSDIVLGAIIPSVIVLNLSMQNYVAPHGRLLIVYAHCTKYYRKMISKNLKHVFFHLR
jgi:hypothetical protein